MTHCTWLDNLEGYIEVSDNAVAGVPPSCLHPLYAPSPASSLSDTSTTVSAPVLAPAPGILALLVSALSVNTYPASWGSAPILCSAWMLPLTVHLSPALGICKTLPSMELQSLKLSFTVLEVSTRTGRSSEGGPGCPLSDKVRSEVEEAGDCRWNENRNCSSHFTYENTGPLKGEPERLHNQPEWTLGHSVSTAHSETVTDQVSVAGKLPETDVVGLLQEPGQVTEPLRPSVSSLVKALSHSNPIPPPTTVTLCQNAPCLGGMGAGPQDAV
ncbi:hypothetical protein AAY473_040170 [Plecturocebus cupreus]